MSSGQSVYRRFEAHWEDHFAPYELALASALALAFAFWVFTADGWATVSAAMDGKRGQLYGTLAALLGSLFGFAIAAAAIVMGETGRLDLIREAQQLQNLVGVFGTAIRALGLGAIVAVAALVLDSDSHAIRFPLILVLFSSTLALLRLSRVVWLLDAVMRHAAKPR